MACRTCRDRKTKCDETRPICTHCRQRNVQCVYTAERGKRRKPNHHGSSFTGTYRFVEPMTGSRRKRGRRCAPPAVQVNGTVPPTGNAPLTGLDDGTNHAPLAGGGSGKHGREQGQQGEVKDRERDQGVDAEQHLTRSTRSRHASLDGAIGSSSSIIESNQRPETRAPVRVQSSSGNDAAVSVTPCLIDMILDSHSYAGLPGRNPAVWIQTEDGGEYTGASSGISSISDLNLKWLRTHLHESDALLDTLKGVRSGLLSYLTQPKCITTDMWPCPDSASSSLRPLPSRKDVEKYVDAYFSDVQVIYPILDRARFEARLSQYYQDWTACTDSWKALLNAVIASGCRAALSDETVEAFQRSGRESWAYFRNALCYETKLVHGATDLTAVQALVVMAVFAQGMSSPQRLEYTLCSTASRLAQGLALNLHPPTVWNMSECENHERNRTFWVIYCLDKSIALRCGRPPTIRDSEISSLFPRNVAMMQSLHSSSTRLGRSPGKDIVDFDFFLMIAKLSRIDGRIALDLYSVAALCRPAIELLATAKKILSDLEDWRRSFPENVRPGQSFSRLPVLGHGSRQRLLALHFSYYHAICATHRRFTLVFTHLDQGEDHVVESKLPETPVSHIEAARSMVLLTKYLDIESYTPGWLVFYYPMTALVAIFMHVVCNPLAASTRNDIALMDAAVGFFGRLEYVTSGEAAFTQMGEFVRQVRHIVAKAREDANREDMQVCLPGSEQNELAATTFQMPQDIHYVSSVSESAGINAAEDQGGIGMLESAELLDGSLTVLTLPTLEMSPGSVPNVDWLDAWTTPRLTEGLVFDSLQNWT